MLLKNWGLVKKSAEIKRYTSVLGGFLFLCGLIFLNGPFLFGRQSGREISRREEIRFDSGQFRIVGDLHIPNPNKKQPTIIFVHGDGPARRRSSGEPNRIMSCFLDIGFACLFYDKPGYGESVGEFTRGKLFEERASILLDAVATLKNHPAVEPGQIGLWGISQAGYVMPKALTKTNDIAFMIAVSCPGTDSIEQSAYLVEKQVLCEGYDQRTAKKVGLYYRQRARAKTYREYLEAAEYLDQNPVVSSMRWGGIFPEEDFSPRPPSHQSFFNPVTLLEKIKIPVLALFGENDTQIDPYQGAEAYEKAFKKARNHFYQVKLFPGADHGILISSTGCMKDRGNNRGYAPGYLELMQEWLKNLSNKWNAEKKQAWL